jgi:hypothetical protein
MKKQFTAITLLTALCAMPFASIAATDTKKPVAKKQVKAPARATTKAAAVAAGAAATTATASGKKMAFNSDEEDTEHEPDVSGTSSWNLSCELGNNLMMYANDADNRHIAIRWQNKINRLTRVSTSTGANRFENKKAGLLWIDIPAKGMLLDTKKGRQLANECTQSAQAKKG